MKRWALLLPLVLVVLFGLAANAQAVDNDSAVTADNFEVMLLVDTSASMRQNDAIAKARDAATQFGAQMPPNVRIGLVSFGDNVNVVTAPITDRAVLNDGIAGLEAAGSTHLHDALIVTAQSFTPAGAHKAIVLLSDGGDEGSTSTLDDALTALSGIHVEAISLTTPKTDNDALARIGTISSADDPTQLPVAFGRVADLLTKIVAPTTVPAPAPTAAAPTTIPATVAPRTTVAPPATTELTFSPGTAPEEPKSQTEVGLVASGVLVFLALAAIVLLAWPRVKVSKQRLGIVMPKHSLTDTSKRATSAIEELLAKRGRKGALTDVLARAGLSIQPGEFLLILLLVAVVVALLGFVIAGPLLALGLALIVGLAFRWFVNFKVRRRQAAFAEQLPDVLQLLISSLRSGYGLSQALDSVAEEAEEPARSQFSHALVEVRLGREIGDALRVVAKNMDSQDLEWAVAAIDIQHETGGNLAETLQNVATTIRERQKMRRQVRSLTAEGRLSAKILTALPLTLSLWMALVHPGYFSDMASSSGGVFALVTGGILLILGNLWIKKMVSIKM
jgi:tight adherence protein B